MMTHSDIHNSLSDSLVDCIVTDDQEGFKDLFHGADQQADPTVVFSGCPVHITRQFHLTNSPYSPDTVWCLAAVYNARKIMTLLHDESVMVTQANSHGNNILHCLVAYASIMDEPVEEEAAATAAFIRELLDEDEYEQLLLSENEHGLRPLELAAHLGAFVLYKYFLNTKGVYITREETFMWYTIQYYDVTEYMDRTRFVRSPPFLMMHLDQEKLCHKSVNDVFLGEPMKSWFHVLYRINKPYIYTMAMIRFLYILLFFGYVFYYFYLAGEVRKEFIRLYGPPGILINTTSPPTTTSTSPATATTPAEGSDSQVNTYWLFIVFPQILLLLYSSLAIIFNLVAFIQMRCLQPKWISRKVTGTKCVVTNYTFYHVAQLCTLLMIFMCTFSSFGTFHFEDQLKYFITAAVIMCVWDILYYLQLVPIFDIYVIAVQRMLKDFANFSLLYCLFFLPYVLGFGMMFFKSFDIYATFLIMLNMQDFGAADMSVQLMHMAYVFVIAILLLTYIVAMMGSTYEHMRNHGELLRQLQFLSVTLVAQNYFPCILRPLHRRLCQRYMVYEDGRYYVTRVLMRPRNPSPDAVP